MFQPVRRSRARSIFAPFNNYYTDPDLMRYSAIATKDTFEDTGSSIENAIVGAGIGYFNLAAELINFLSEVPNIPAYVARKTGNSADAPALEFFGQMLPLSSASGLTSEVAEGLQVYRDAAQETKGSASIVAAAMDPRVQYRPNPGGELRELEEAVEIARRNGVDIDLEKYAFRLDKTLAANVYASYKDIPRAPNGLNHH
jgi:hypothetical protein